ncbi:L-erythro-3-methylmalyl-CoA dehydratase [Permianibacter aggregans]|uniref:L-erythro-3-methylmalyl-CoA dehydratase n=2 Tax=Permianibacter aggregans TaxID=1510150 RepID=A0A4R6UD95_9GAMM|nr:L-erythro-3-methylmalyl-CoA dehydratase [Permianibacter aggregans]
MTVGRFFEDFNIGEKITHATPRTITEGDAAFYIALYGSRFPQYSAHQPAQLLGLEKMPIDPMLVFHVAFGKTVPDVSLNAVANLGYADVRFITPVYAGDTLFVESEVIGLKENSSGKTGIVYVHSTARNQSNRIAVSWKRWVMVHKRDISRATGHNTVPELPSQLEASELPVPSHFKASRDWHRYSGSKKYAADYKVGEIISHGGGITIGDSDHMLATRLYQNNARVHFDGAHMAGKRLVYGGHIMSLCQAMSFNGLENALWIAGFNGGTHANPSYANDTIYSASVVLDNQHLPGNINALRIVTFGSKKELAGCDLDDLADLSLAQKLPEHIVLRWDYWVLMA